MGRLASGKLHSTLILPMQCEFQLLDLGYAVIHCKEILLFHMHSYYRGYPVQAISRLGDARGSRDSRDCTALHGTAHAHGTACNARDSRDARDCPCTHGSSPVRARAKIPRAHGSPVQRVNPVQQILLVRAGANPVRHKCWCIPQVLVHARACPCKSRARTGFTGLHGQKDRMEHREK